MQHPSTPGVSLAPPYCLRAAEDVALLTAPVADIVLCTTCTLVPLNCFPRFSLFSRAYCPGTWRRCTCSARRRSLTWCTPHWTMC